MNFVAVDIEGNGATPPEIVELAAVRFDTSIGIGEARSWLVKPPNPIHWRAEQVHGISNSKITDAPMIGAVEGDIIAFLGTDIAVAHNAVVDVGIMRKELSRWQPSGIVDTLKLARHLVPGQPSYKLFNLLIGLGIAQPEEEQRAHRAEADAVACAKLFLKLVEIAKSRGLSPNALVTRLIPGG